MKICEGFECSNEIKIPSIDCRGLCLECAKLERRSRETSKKFFERLRAARVVSTPRYNFDEPVKTSTFDTCSNNGENNEQP